MSHYSKLMLWAAIAVEIAYIGFFISMTDSFTVSFLNHVYEALVRYDADLKIEPALATSWEQIDETTVRYTLREGIKFHDGQDFSAEDVVASVKRAAHEDSPIRGNIAGLVDAKMVDEMTVDLMLDGPNPLLNNFLTNVLIFDSGWLEEHDAIPVASEGDVMGAVTQLAVKSMTGKTLLIEDSFSCGCFISIYIVS